MANPSPNLPADADIHLNDDITDVLQLLEEAGENGVQRILEVLDSIGGL